MCMSMRVCTSLIASEHIVVKGSQGEGGEWKGRKERNGVLGPLESLRHTIAAKCTLGAVGMRLCA